jgi:hypothetical protein
MWNGIPSQNLEVTWWGKNLINFKEIRKLITVYTRSSPPTTTTGHSVTISQLTSPLIRNSLQNYQVK